MAAAVARLAEGGAEDAAGAGVLDAVAEEDLREIGREREIQKERAEDAAGAGVLDAVAEEDLGGIGRERDTERES